MPAPELTDRYQKAQLWKCVGHDEYGEPIVREREEITVRWENKTIEMLDRQNQPIRVDAFIHYVCEIPTDSILWLGSYKDLLEAHPDWETDKLVKNLMQVLAQRYTPDIKGRVTRRTFGLIRFKDKLPTIFTD